MGITPQAMLADHRDEIERAAAHLRAGRLVAIPTETVYGLAADASNARAVAEVFQIKARPHFDPLIVHIADRVMIPKLVTDFPPLAETLTRRFWPGPLTLVLPRIPDAVPDIVTAGLDTVALRMPDHPLTLAVLQRTGRPLAAPSANRFGRISPTTAAHVRDELGDRIAMVLDGGPCRTGIESTVVSLAGDRPTLLRPGGTPVEAIEAIIGPLADPEVSAGTAAPASPGMLERHYAPGTPLQLMSHPPTSPPRVEGRLGLLMPQPCRDVDVSVYSQVELLSASGDLTEAATNLFAAMRRLDEAGLTLIIAITAPQSGLGIAINDRLRRAAMR